MLFGIAGPTASGKTTITNLLAKEYRAGYLRYSLILADIAVDRNLDPTDKATLQGLYITLRKERGESWLAEEIVDRAEELGCEHLMIEGNRRKVDIEALKDVADRRHEKLIFIFIDASLETRFERYNNRLAREDKSPITFSEFEKLEANPAEDEIEDLRHYAKENGIYIDTDEYGIKAMEEIIKEAIKAHIN